MVTRGFAGANAGPTPRIEPADWTFTLKVGPHPVKAWSWSEFNALPRTRVTRDIHCVTSWSKLNTAWEGVAVDDILADAGLSAPTPFALAHCYDGYSTNVPLADLVTGKAMVALKYEGQPLPRDLEFVGRVHAEAVHLERPLQRHHGAFDRLQERYRGQGRNRKVDAKLKR
jgi:DMSO/TMAO reductase YedYZ molybdopterin-dependent catalytic subunit